MAEAEEPVAAVQPEGAAPEGAGASALLQNSRPLVATPGRWAAGSVAFALGLAVAAEGTLLFLHSSRPFETLVGPLATGAVAASLLLVVLLRAEESRLARELRTARTGTPVLRALIARRRIEQPFLARFASTPVGTAAVLVADGDREGALDLLAKIPALMRGGRLDTLRNVVRADLHRGDGTPAGLARCVSELRGMEPLGNREADLYRMHVLVKAILAKGDGEAAFELATRLAGREGEAVDDERVYATWLRVWFDLDLEVRAAEGADANAWPALSEGDLRVATLIARAHGAESLVTKLTTRLSGIAHTGPRG